MASLPVELWHQIAGEVYATGDMSAILAMCLSSPLLRNAADPWLYQRVTLSMGKPHEIMGFKSGLAHGGTSCGYVLSLTILPRDCVADNLPPGTVGHLVSSLPNLRSLNWNCSLPVQHSSLQVVIPRPNLSDVQTHHDVGNALGGTPPLNALWTSWKLCTVNLSFEWNHQTRDGNPSFQHGQMVVLNAPTLQHLSIDIRYHHDRHQFEPPNSNEAFRFPTNRMLPPMKTLALRGYTLGWEISDGLEHRLQVSFLRDLTLQPGLFSYTDQFLATLMRRGNLRLKVLDICSRSLSGSLGNPEVLGRYTGFFKSFKGLEKVAIRGNNALPYDQVVDAISWHGESLEILDMYDPDCCPPTTQGFAQSLRITPVVVQKLCDLCTRLRELTLYLHFGDDITLQQSFKHFQALESLTIYSPLRRRVKEYLEPLVDEAYVRNLAVQIRSPLLREATLHVGQYTLSTRPDYTRSMKWENERRMVWHIEYLQFGTGIMVWESI